jgi:(E)-4-hydroxy-3-methylbut-2-enyl-diphosphate synthase
MSRQKILSALLLRSMNWKNMAVKLPGLPYWMKQMQERFLRSRRRVNLPIVADIHFNYLLALIAAEGGVDAIRINPGNIGSKEHTEAVVNACKEHHIPIRIGINGGSLEKDLIEKYGGPCADAFIESADRHVKILEDLDFHDICLSFKSSNVELTIAAYEAAAAHIILIRLHLGVTEAGGFTESAVKSSAALERCSMKALGIRSVSLYQLRQKMN